MNFLLFFFMISIPAAYATVKKAEIISDPTELKKWLCDGQEVLSSEKPMPQCTEKVSDK